MKAIFSIKPVMHVVAAATLAGVSFAAAAQSTPAAGICERELYASQKRLHDRFLAGPDALRDYVFRLRAVRLLDIYQVDAWARRVSMEACTAHDANAAAASPAFASSDG